MDYQTFINSAFLVQGRADEFTVKPPGERKQILADILGLSLYDEIEDLASQRAKQHEAQRRLLEGEIQTIDAELAHETIYHTELTARQEELARLSTELKDAEETLRRLRERKSTLDLKAGQLKDIDGRIARAERDIAGAEAQSTAHRQRVIEYEGVLARRSSIEDGYTALCTAREENEALNRSLSRLSSLQIEERQAERIIDGERSRLVAEQRTLHERINDLRQRQRAAAGREPELADLQAAIEQLSALEARREAANQTLLELSGRRGALQNRDVQLKGEGTKIRRKMDELAGVTHCPLCNTSAQ